MDDNLNNKIKQITDMLGQENMPDNLKSFLSMLEKPNKENSDSPNANESPPIRDMPNSTNENQNTFEMVHKIKKAMDHFNSANDPRITLLTAVKPFLNEARQKKLTQCVKLLQVSSIAKLMDENGKGFF